MYGSCTDASRAKRALRSAASTFVIAIHIIHHKLFTQDMLKSVTIHADICTQYMLKSSHKTCSNLHTIYVQICAQ